MIPKEYIKAIIISICYYLLTIGLSIFLYKLLGLFFIENFPNYLKVIETIIYIILIFLFVIIFKKSVFPPKTKSNNLKYLVKNIFYILIIALLYRILIDPLYRINIIIGENKLPDIPNKPISISAIIIFLNIVILAPIIEELVFRRIILSSLLKRQTVLISILFSSFLFSLIHINFFPLSFNYITILNAFFVGVLAGIIYVRYNIQFSILFHVFINLIWFVLTIIFQKKYWEIITFLNFTVIYWIIVLSSLIILIIFLLKQGYLFFQNK